MAIKKGAGGLEDLALGMSTVEQIRKGMPVTITQINAGNIPYSATQSITQKMENFDGAQEAVYVELDKKAVKEDVYAKTEYITKGGTSADAGKPIVLDSTGQLDPSIAGSGLYPVGMYTPTAGAEYPDTTGETYGAYWGVLVAYTFVGGDLAGLTVDPNDTVIFGSQAWGVFYAPTGSDMYYTLDGSRAIIAPFAGGGQLISNIANGVAVTDAATKGQIDTKANLSGANVFNALQTINAKGTCLTIGGTAAVGEACFLAGLSVDGLARGWYLGRNAGTSDGIILANDMDGANINIATTGVGKVLANGLEVLTSAGGELTSNLAINTNNSAITIGGSNSVNDSAFMRGIARDGITNGWFLGRGNGDINDISLHNYMDGANLNLVTTGAGQVIVNGTPIVAVGEIKQWAGKLTDIPNGWNLADGSKGTVDMTADFKAYGTTTVVFIQFIGA